MSANPDAGHPAASSKPAVQEQTLDLVALLGGGDPNSVEADTTGSSINSGDLTEDNRSTDPAGSAISLPLDTAPLAALFVSAVQTPLTGRTAPVTEDALGSGSNAGRPLTAVTATEISSSAADLTTLLTNTAHSQSDAAQAAFASSVMASPDGGTTADSATTATTATSASSATSGPDASATAAAIAHLVAATHASGRDNNLSRSELRAPVGTPDWNNELGQQLTWMSQQGIDSASLRLSPAHLGPLEVQISVQNGAASVWFGASHADTRAALERALPELRQMFASQGLALTDSGVSREPPRNATRSNASHGMAAVSAVGAPAAGGAAATTIGLGLIDTYA